MQIHVRTTYPARKGFTIIEVILVIAIMGSLAMLAAPFLSDTLSRNDLAIASDGAVDALREARSSSMSGRGTGLFGVHFETTKFVFFEGATYGASDPDNVTHALGGNVTITAIAISGGGSDVHFAGHKGEPTETGSITFTDVGGNVRTVTVNAAGLVETD